MGVATSTVILVVFFQRLKSEDACVLSRKFCSAENFGQGPIFSGKIVPPGSIFSEKNGPVLKILFRFTFSIVMNYLYYDVKESAKKQIGSNNSV